MFWALQKLKTVLVLFDIRCIPEKLKMLFDLLQPNKILYIQTALKKGQSVDVTIYVVNVLLYAVQYFLVKKM